jgi:hypothetical protein
MSIRKMFIFILGYTPLEVTLYLIYMYIYIYIYIYNWIEKGDCKT